MMKKGDMSFISGRSSNSLKLILKVGTAPSSDSEHIQESSLHSDSFSNLSNENSAHSFATPTTESIHSSKTKHKKSKKKKKKKHKEKHHHHHHHKSKKRHFSEISQEEDSISDLLTANESISNDATILDTSFRSSTHGENILGGSSSPKTSLQKLLEHIHGIIEQKDIRQFFAWPVTDRIAPGYFSIISHPMDLHTIRCKIDSNEYKSFQKYVDDFRLMCQNAMIYNHPDTVYYKAAKKLLHAGIKITNPDKIRTLQSDLPFLNDLSNFELGFNLNPTAEDELGPVKSEIYEDDNEFSRMTEDDTVKKESDDIENENSSGEEILAQVREASRKLMEKNSGKSTNQVGYLRPNSDGSTTLQILIPGTGIDPDTKERPITLGALVGKLTHGNSTWHSFREDKRNIVKPIKPLNYGTYGSYAPSYDSTFANLTKDETDLLFQTYGNESGIHYAESVLNFSKDSDYMTEMVDNLLDIMTSGEHKKTKKFLEEKKRIREEIDNKIDDKNTAATVAVATGTTPQENKMTAENNEQLNYLKFISEIDTSFVDYYADLCKEKETVTSKLFHTRALIEKLHQMQNERLSSTMPQHLSHVASVAEVENQLADRLTESLMHIIKKVPPGIVTSVSQIRKALGITAQLDSLNKITPSSHNSSSSDNNAATGIDSSSAVTGTNFPKPTSDSTANNGISEEGTTRTTTGLQPPNVPYVTGIDLETELREFLENGPELGNFELPDDRTIEQMLTGNYSRNTDLW